MGSGAGRHSERYTPGRDEDSKLHNGHPDKVTALSSKGSEHNGGNELRKPLRFLEPFVAKVQQQELRQFQPHVDFLRTIASAGTQLDVYVSTIINEVLRIVNADRASVFFVDEVRKEVWSVGTSNCETFSMPWDKGIVGLSAHGQLINLQDAHAHSSFDPTVEKATGYVVRTLLSIPIMHIVDAGRTVGVVQVLNKKGTPDAVFTDHDERELEKLIMVITDSFYRQRWRALESGARGDREALSVIAMHGQDKSAGSVRGNNKTVGRSPSAVGPGAACTSAQERFIWQEESTLGVRTSPSLPSRSYVGTSTALETLRTLSFNVLECTPQELVVLVPVLMGETRITEQCAIVPERLRTWASAACRTYRDNPFHNWFHGFFVFHMCYFQLMYDDVSSELRYVDVFGLLIAALCHDLDHPGVTNSFLVDGESELAIRYNDTSVLENHHAALACQLLRNEDMAIGAGLERSEQQALRRIIIKCILDTDMARHREMCQATATLVTSGITPELACNQDRQSWLSQCLHAADLSAQVCPWFIAEQWEARISREFLNQAAEESAAGLTPAPFMQFSFDDLKQRGKLQRNFIDFVLVPLWDPYTQLIPDLRVCFDSLLANRGMYDYRSVHGVDAPEQPQSPKARCAG